MSITCTCRTRRRFQSRMVLGKEFLYTLMVAAGTVPVDLWCVCHLVTVRMSFLNFRLILLYKGIASIPTDDLIPKTRHGRIEISTLWHFRIPLLIQMFIKVASSLRLSGIGMPSPVLWSHLLKMQRIVLLSSLRWWELGTNFLITGPGEWLSFWRFTSKLSWSCHQCPYRISNAGSWTTC